MTSVASNEVHIGLTAELPHLKRFAYSLTRTSQASDDLVQDCVERALKYRDKFEPGTNLRAWLFRMMRNLHINKKRRERCERSYLDGEAVKDAFYTPANQDSNVQLQELKRAFTKLPMQERAALLLITLKGLSYADAAARLHCEVGTVKSRVFRARKRLCEMDVF